MLILLRICKCYKLPNVVCLLWFALIGAHCITENVLQYLYDANLIKTSSIKMRQRTGLVKEGNWDINISLWIFHIWIFYRYIFYYFRKIAHQYTVRRIPHIIRWLCACRVLYLRSKIKYLIFKPGFHKYHVKMYVRQSYISKPNREKCCLIVIRVSIWEMVW